MSGREVCNSFRKEGLGSDSLLDINETNHVRMIKKYIRPHALAPLKVNFEGAKTFFEGNGSIIGIFEISRSFLFSVSNWCKHLKVKEEKFETDYRIGIG